MQLCGSLSILWYCLSLGLEWNCFQSCGHCWVSQICWHIECSTLRIWNSSTGIPSPLIAVFVLMLCKAHLTSHSRMYGSRWVITPSWLSGSWRSFLYSSSYSCHLFLIFPLLLGQSHFCPLLSLSLHETFPWNLIFLKRFLVLPILLFPSISFHWSLKKVFLSLLAILWNSAFKYVYFSFSPLLLFFSQLFVRLPQTAILLLCISWGWSWSLSPVQCLESHELDMDQQTGSR